MMRTLWSFLGRRTLTQWILAGMVGGVVLGWLAPELSVKLQPASTLFLRMIKSIIVPLIFATLVGASPGTATTSARSAASPCAPSSILRSSRLSPWSWDSWR